MNTETQETRSAKSLAQRIQALRRARGMSQEELAEQIGVSRQAVSKWEAEQSTPEPEKLILLSGCFGVTTDFLLKGTEPVPCPTKRQSDARIYAIIATACNFAGLAIAICVWLTRQTEMAVAAGAVIMAVGCAVFAVGQCVGSQRQDACTLFIGLNVWLLTLMPISCVFNAVDGTLGGFWWTLTPIPQLGNSLLTFGLCWLFYLALCVCCDAAVYRKSKQRHTVEK